MAVSAEARKCAEACIDELSRRAKGLTDDEIEATIKNVVMPDGAREAYEGEQRRRRQFVRRLAEARHAEMIEREYRRLRNEVVEKQLSDKELWQARDASWDECQRLSGEASSKADSAMLLHSAISDEWELRSAKQHLPTTIAERRAEIAEKRKRQIDSIAQRRARDDRG